jgi:hypothetical protein
LETDFESLKEEEMDLDSKQRIDWLIELLSYCASFERVRNN